MSSNFLSHLQAKDKRETTVKVTKAIASPAVNLATNITVDGVCKYPAVEKAVVGAAYGLADAAIDGVKSACDQALEESESKLMDESDRRYDSTLKFKMAVLFVSPEIHYFKIDGALFNKPFDVDQIIVKLKNFKLDGLPPNEYSLRPTGPDIEDRLPAGPCRFVSFIHKGYLNIMQARNALYGLEKNVLNCQVKEN